MQKTDHHARLLHLSATGKVFCIFAVLLVLVVISARAENPVLTLAISQSSAENFPLSPVNLASGTNSFYFNLVSSLSEAVVTNSQTAADVSFASAIKFQPEVFLDESSWFIREAIRTRKPVTVQAGYGRIWDDHSTLQKICADHEDPGCAYVSANFSF